MTDSTDGDAPPGPAFAHASEAEMARILDFYDVRWQYEPHTFPILWNLDGDVVESFSPDFWLPDLGMYLELTTLKQRLVRKKNRKLRRLRELYPDIRIKLFYARDFRALMLKYGRIDVIGALSGTAGQMGAVDDRETEMEQVLPIEPAGPIAPLGAVADVAVPTTRSGPLPVPLPVAPADGDLDLPRPSAAAKRRARRRAARRRTDAGVPSVAEA